MSGPARTAAPVPTTENCRFCWMCRHVCPVGHVTHRETYTPHAWALTIESVKRGQLRWDREATAVLYACADCGLCQSHCATDQPLPDAIAAARADVVAAGLAPDAVMTLDQTLREALHRRSTAPPVPVRTTTSSGVALFVGDASHESRSRSVEAAVRLLAVIGVRAELVGVGRSSGATAAALGLRHTASALADVVIDEVRTSGATELLVLTPGDRWAFEHVYPVRLGKAWPSTVVVRDVVTMLAVGLAAGRLSFAPAVNHPAYAYHDPCHAPRIGRDGRAPRALLAAATGAPGRDLFWREGRAHPCGAIGGLEITHPDIAGRLADARLADATAAGAESLVTEDPVCLQQLRARTSGIEVVDLYTLLAERVKGNRVS